jgi:hypothetical protein
MLYGSEQLAAKPSDTTYPHVWFSEYMTISICFWAFMIVEEVLIVY